MEVIQPCFGVVDVATVCEGIVAADGGCGAGVRNDIAPCIVDVGGNLSSCGVYDGNYVTLNVGDVIVFQTFDKILIHRVVEIEEIDGVKYYRTKGDVNGSRDNIDVTKDKIYGKVKFRIPYIAYPSVWVSEKLK